MLSVCWKSLNMLNMKFKLIFVILFELSLLISNKVALSLVIDVGNSRDVLDYDPLTVYKTIQKLIEEKRKAVKEEAERELYLSELSRTMRFRHAGEMSGNHKDSMRLHFPLTLNDDDIERAAVRLLASGPVDKSALVTVQVYHVLEGGKQLVDFQHVIPEPTWIEIEVTDTVKSWTSGRSKNLGLEVHCVSCSGNGVTLLAEDPILDVLLKERDSHKRNKRQMYGPCSTEYPKRCCRHELQFNPRDFRSLDFIQEPSTSFDIGICLGGCPIRHRVSSNHAIFQAAARKQNLTKERLPKVCCTASLSENITVKFNSYEDGAPEDTVDRVWVGAIVKDCFCA